MHFGDILTDRQTDGQHQCVKRAAAEQYCTSQRRRPTVQGPTIGLPEKHGYAGMRHVPADRLPRLGDGEHLAFSQRHSDATLQLIQTAVGLQRRRA